MNSLKSIPTDRISIAPSILAADFANLETEVKKTEKAGADLLHLDVMDGHFVPNITMGPPIIKCLRRHTSLVFDTHLMITDPLTYSSIFIKSGSDHITFHIESDNDPQKVIDEIKGFGATVGISLKPKTSADEILEYLPQIDLVLVMTVEPGFGGQSFMPDMMKKVEKIRSEIDRIGKNIHLQVDGGIAIDTINIAYKSGANNFVAGTSVFGHPEGITEAIRKLKSINR